LAPVVGLGFVRISLSVRRDESAVLSGIPAYAMTLLANAHATDTQPTKIANENVAIFIIPSQ